MTMFLVYLNNDIDEPASLDLYVDTLDALLASSLRDDMLRMCVASAVQAYALDARDLDAVPVDDIERVPDTASLSLHFPMSDDERDDADFLPDETPFHTIDIVAAVDRAAYVDAVERAYALADLAHRDPPPT